MTTREVPDAADTSVRYFLTYSGVALPLALVEELTVAALRNRNTYFRASYDAAGRPVRIEKRVYDEIEMCHDYRYREDGSLCEAIVSMADEEPQVLRIGHDGTRS